MYPFDAGAHRTLLPPSPGNTNPRGGDQNNIKEIYGNRGLGPCIPPPTEYIGNQHRYPGFDINNPRHMGFPACEPLPGVGQSLSHSFDAIFEGDIELEGELVHVLALSTTGVNVVFNSPVIWDTEMTQLDIFGGQPGLIPYEGVLVPPELLIREDPGRASLGQIFLVGNHLTSYFDVFSEISFDGGLNWVDLIGSTRMEAEFTFVPEPSTWVLVATGVLALVGSRAARARRRTPRAAL